MQGGLLHRSHSILMIFNPILCYLSPKILIFQELLIIETWNKCHWIWHALNPKYATLKPFWWIFPSQNQQNVKFLPEIVIFQEPLIVETQNLHAIGFGMPQTLNMCHSSHFNAFFPVKINKMMNCWLFAELPLTKNEKMHQFEQGKSVLKRLENQCTYRFLGIPIAMHYVRTLCDKYFLSYDGFSWFLTGRFRHRVLKHGVGVEWDARRTAV